MMKRTCILLIFIATSMAAYSQKINRTDTEAIDRAYLEQDISTLISFHTSAPDLKKKIEDFLFIGIDYNEYTYEQILEFCRLSGNDDILNKEFERIKADKDVEILEYVSQLTAEQLAQYLQYFKERKTLVDLYIHNTIQQNLDLLSYLELSYIERKSGFSFMEEIKRKKVEKKSEIRQIFKNELNTYCDMEEKQLPKLFYILRYKALNYIYSSFGQIAERYSNVELPEYPNEMTRQFDNIMNSYLDIHEFNDILQQEVARFCQKINSTRTFYLQQVGRQNNFNWIVHFSPLHSFEYKYNMSYFHEIAGIRDKLLESQEKTSTWSGVLGFFTDWAGVGKALLDMGSITDEAKQEVQLRKDYMLSIVTSLELSIEKYCMEIENDIKRNYHMNQKEFKEYVFKNF